MTDYKTYPHLIINVDDKSIYRPVIDEFMPLHQPHYAFPTRKGKPNVPIWYPQFSDAEAELGPETFDMMNKKYFTREAYFLNRSFQHNGAWITRLVPQDAKTSYLVLELVSELVFVPQYERDADGFFTKGNDGEYHIIEKNYGTNDDRELYHLGVKMTWQVRPLKTTDNNGNPLPNPETPYTLVPVSENTGKYTIDGAAQSLVDKHTVPVMVFAASSPGEWGNELGFNMWYDVRDNDDSQMRDRGALSLRFAPVEIDAKSNNAVPVLTKYNNRFCTLVLKPDAVSSATGMPVSIDKVLKNQYEENLPFETTYYFELLESLFARAVYYENLTFTITVPDPDNPGQTMDIQTQDLNMIGDFTIDAGTGERTFNVTDTNVTEAVFNPGRSEVVEIINSEDGMDYIEGRVVDPWYLNPVSMKDNSLASYYNIVNSDKQTKLEPVILAKDYVNFMLNGSDGDLSLNSRMGMLMDYFQVNGNGNPDIVDRSRYSFTHIFDVGYPKEVKEVLMGFLDIRDDVKVTFSTDMYAIYDETTEDFFLKTHPNTQADDEAALVTMIPMALVHRESIIKGTEACRATFFCQVGKTHDFYDEWLPMTLWSAIKKAEYQNLDYLDLMAKGRPNSENHYFKEFNYVPASEKNKEDKWDLGGNYCQYYNNTDVHFPSVRTINPYDTSALSDDETVDAIVYTKHVMRRIWTVHVGKSDWFNILKQIVESHIRKELTYMYNGHYKFDVVFYQTEEEQKLGYIHHIRIRLLCPNTSRVWNVDIEVYREGYNVPEGLGA